MSGAAAGWRALVERMCGEVARGEARAETYWAQQLAFGPVFVHALRLHLRDAPPDPPRSASLARVVRLARDALAALPEPCGADPTALATLARRQARALAWGRRGCLDRLRAVIGAPGEVAAVVPERHLRAYPLIGWRPET